MENSRRREICNVTVHRASLQKHLRSEKDLENEKQMKWLYENGYLKKSKHLSKKYISLKW